MRRARTATRRTQATAGMTLIELLVAMAIFAVIAGGLYGTFARAAAGRDLATRRAALYSSARRVVGRLEQDIKGSFNTGLYNADFKRFFSPAPDSFTTFDKNRTVFDATVVSARGTGSPDGLGLGLRAADDDRGDQARVIYRLEEDANLVRYEQRPPRPGELDFDELTGEVMAEGAAALSLRFSNGQEWFDEWDSGVQGRNRGHAPYVVETRLRLEVSDGPPLEVVSSVVVALGVLRR